MTRLRAPKTATQPKNSRSRVRAALTITCPAMQRTAVERQSSPLAGPSRKVPLPRSRTDSLYKLPTQRASRKQQGGTKVRLEFGAMRRTAEAAAACKRRRQVNAVSSGSDCELYHVASFRMQLTPSDGKFWGSRMAR